MIILVVCSGGCVQPAVAQSGAGVSANGGNDGDVSPSNAIQLAAALEKLGKPYELKVFYGEKHVLTGRAAERDEDAANWFRRFDVQHKN